MPDHEITDAELDPEALAERFHNVYESWAPCVPSQRRLMEAALREVTAPLIAALRATREREKRANDLPVRTRHGNNVMVRMSDELLALVERRAAEEKTSVSEIVRAALYPYLSDDT